MESTAPSNSTSYYCDRQSINQSKALYAVDQNVTANNIKSYNKTKTVSINAVVDRCVGKKSSKFATIWTTVCVLDIELD